MIKKVCRSFSAKVVLWVLLIAIPIFFLTIGLLFRQSRKMVRAEAVDRASGVLKTAMHRINRYLVTAETATNTYAWLSEQNMQPDSLRTFAERAVFLNPYVDGCAISTEPKVLAQYPERFMAYSLREADTVKTVIDSELNYFNRKWYRTPRLQQKSSWVLYYDETNTLNMDEEGMMATYSKPLYDASQHFLGVISIEFSLLHLSKIMAEVKPYPHSYYMMIDEQGRYVGHPDSTRLFSKTIFSVADPQKQSDLIALGYEMTKGNQGNMSVMINGQRSLVCYMPVPETTWSLAIVCPDDDILRGYNRLTYTVIALLLVGLLFIIINCYKAITATIGPLDLLMDKAMDVADGNMSVDIPHTKRIDVIGNLQNSFASMLESLNYYITNVRRASDQNKRYNMELEHTTQMVIESEKQKTAFIQNVTHQIRTPLNIVMGFAQVLSSPADDSSLSEGLSAEELKSIASTMNHNTKQLVRMVLMLFDSSDTGTAESVKVEKADVNIAAAAKDALDYTHNMFPDIQIKYSNSLPDDFCVRSDYRSVVYSIQEIIHNAIKYSDGQNISLHVEKTFNMVRFIIQDTGRGIAVDDLDRIFKFFTKNDGFSEGLGLGLPLTKRHVETLGGNLMLDTTYQEGCRFIIEIPLT